MLPDPPITKRQLGWLLTGAGMLAAAAVAGADLIGAGNFTGIGPAQRQALGAALLVAIFGLSLWPLGHRPA